jgi:hypothetical protein
MWWILKAGSAMDLPILSLNFGLLFISNESKVFEAPKNF